MALASGEPKFAVVVNQTVHDALVAALGHLYDHIRRNDEASHAGFQLARLISEISGHWSIEPGGVGAFYVYRWSAFA